MTELIKRHLSILSILICICLSLTYSISSLALNYDNQKVIVESMDSDIYQMVEDYENGTFKQSIADPSFSVDKIFGESDKSTNKSSIFAKNDIYKVDLLDEKSNTYQATRITLYSNLESENQDSLHDVIVMCRIVYSNIKIDYDTFYKIITVKGGVVRNTNNYIVDKPSLRSTASGGAFNSDGSYAGIHFEGVGTTIVAYTQTAGTVYSIGSGITHFFGPALQGSATGGFSIALVSATHWYQQENLEVGVGWV